MPWQLQIVFGSLFFAAFVVLPMLQWWSCGGSEWWQLRALIKLAKTYGIEYVPGECPKALRERIIERRDALLK
jgi:hypothetical protein